MANDCPAPKKEGHISKSKIVCQTKQDILEQEAKKAQELSEKQAQKSKVFEKSNIEVLKEAIYSSFEKPRIMKRIGPNQIKVMREFLPSAVYFTLAGALCTVYLCEWKHVLQYVPLWRGKYKNE